MTKANRNGPIGYAARRMRLLEESKPAPDGTTPEQAAIDIAEFKACSATRSSNSSSNKAAPAAALTLDVTKLEALRHTIAASIATPSQFLHVARYLLKLVSYLLLEYTQRDMQVHKCQTGIRISYKNLKTGERVIVHLHEEEKSL